MNGDDRQMRDRGLQRDEALAADAWGLAIDFGTTATSAAMCAVEGQISRLAMPDGAVAIPSSVFADGDVLLVGDEADNQAHYRLDCYEPTPKRRVGQDRVLLGDNEFEPSQLIGAVLKAVLSEALNQNSDRVPGSVVLTHPVAWQEMQQQVLTDALRWAAKALQLTQLPEPVFVAEPVAAAHCFARPNPFQEGQTFGVYDLGGGTFDAAVLQQRATEFEVLSRGGIDLLGGFDFDNLLFKYLGERDIAAADPQLWAALTNPDPADTTALTDRRRMQNAVRLLKEGLTGAPEKRCRLPGVRDQVVVTVDEYNGLIRGLIDQSVTELEATIQRARLRPDQVSAIYRIGGASRTPLVAWALGRVHVPVRAQQNPKLVVADGGAVVAHRALLAFVLGPPESSVEHTEPHTEPQRTSVGPPQSATQPQRTSVGPPHPPAGDSDGTETSLFARTKNLAQEGIRKAQEQLQTTQGKGRTSQSTTPANSALELALVNLGIDPRRVCRSRLVLGQARPNVARTMVINRAQFGIDGGFGITAQRWHGQGGFDGYVHMAQEASRRSGWDLWAPQQAMVTGRADGVEQWQRLTSPDGSQQTMVQRFARQGQYMITGWFGERYAGLRDRIYVDTPGGATRLISRFISSMGLTIVVEGVEHERLAEQMFASVSDSGKGSELSAQLSPVGFEPQAVAESKKDDMAAPAGTSRILVNDEQDRFLGDLPCLHYRFEWCPPAAGGVRRPPTVTRWMWVGAVDGRVATIIVESQNPGIPAYELRDLVRLAPNTL
jgi:hypothetical protein